MGKITGGNITNYKSAEYIFAKIRREFKSFGNVNLLDDADFPLYAAEVLNKLGNSAYKEEDALLTVKNKKAILPKYFKNIHAAYSCKRDNEGKDILQRSSVFYNTIECEVYDRFNSCELGCSESNNLVNKVTVKQYLKEGVITHEYKNMALLRLSPNVRGCCSKDSPNLLCSSELEITINNDCIFTNFDDRDIYLQYYAFPMDEEGNILIPDIIEIEKAVEWYIKYQLLLNFWLVDDIKDIQTKWGKAELEYEKMMAEARFINKLPGFQQ